MTDEKVAGGEGAALDATVDTETPVSKTNLIEEADAAVAAAERSVEQAKVDAASADAALAKAKAERDALA